jgi:hypothetical protein
VNVRKLPAYPTILTREEERKNQRANGMKLLKCNIAID